MASSDDREKIHHQLLEELFEARKRVESLEAALAHNAAFLGTGVERESQLGSRPPRVKTDSSLFGYMQLAEPEDDISNFIGREGHDESRPRLGPDAPDEVRPDRKPQVDPLMGQLAFEHPADELVFDPQAPHKPGQAGITARSSPETGAVTRPSNHPGANTTAAESGGAPAAAVVEAGDVASPGRRAEAEADRLTELGERARMALEAINDGIWDWNPNTGHVYTSPRWQSIIGQRSPSDAQAPLESLFQTLESADSEDLRERFQRLIQGKLVRLVSTVRFRKENAWRWGVLRAVALRRDDRLIRLVATLSDITAWREAELALHANRESFRAMADESPDVIIRFDPDGRVLYVSRNISRYFSLSPGTMLGAALREGDTAASDFLFANVRKVAGSGQVEQAELTIDTPLAGKVLADCRFWPEFGADGQITSVSMLARDMTFARQMARNYYSLFNRMEDGFILFEHVQDWKSGLPDFRAGEFVLTVMNPAFSCMFGVRVTDAAGQRLDEVMGQEAGQWAACLKKVLLEGRPVHSLLSLASGEYEISAYSPENERVACIVKNVTEVKRSEHEARLNEARLSAAHRLSHMDAASEEDVIRYSLEQTVAFTDSAFAYIRVMAGHDGEKSRVYWSESMAVMQEGPDEPLLPWAAFEHQGGPRRAEVVDPAEGGFRNPSGHAVMVTRYIAAPVIEEGRIVCVACVGNRKDPYSASDLRRLELFINSMWFHLRRRWAVQALRKAKEAAEAASRAKNEFLANVSHELRTPLNGILGMLQLLQQTRLSEEQTEYVNTAKDSGRSLLRIISDILDLSRMEAGRFELVPQLFDFPAMVRSTLGMFGYQATQKGIRFSLRIDPAIPNLMVGDDARVRQVIFNLVGNAFKFTPHGEIAVECSLLPHCRKGSRCVYLSVADTGIGIPSDKLEDIFQAFTQLNPLATRRTGTGLGLAIVRRLVEMMDGSVTVESVLGQGTTVHCALVFAEAEKPEAHAIQAPGDAAAALPLDVLVVEDDEVSQLTLRKLLQKRGYQPVCVDNGRKALEALLLRPFDCVVTDVQMPVMDGMELTRRIREGDTNSIEPTPETAAIMGLANHKLRRTIPRDIPIIALSAFAMAGDKEHFLNLGVDYYLPKPVDADELYALLAHIGILLQARKGG